MKKHHQDASGINILHKEARLHVLRFLDGQSLRRVYSTCRTWQELRVAVAVAQIEDTRKAIARQGVELAERRLQWKLKRRSLSKEEKRGLDVQLEKIARWGEVSQAVEALPKLQRLMDEGAKSTLVSFYELGRGNIADCFEDLLSKLGSGRRVPEEIVRANLDCVHVLMVEGNYEEDLADTYEVDENNQGHVKLAWSHSKRYAGNGGTVTPELLLDFPPKIVTEQGIKVMLEMATAFAVGGYRWTLRYPEEGLLPFPLLVVKSLPAVALFDVLVPTLAFCGPDEPMTTVSIFKFIEHAATVADSTLVRAFIACIAEWEHQVRLKSPFVPQLTGTLFPNNMSSGAIGKRSFFTSKRSRAVLASAIESIGLIRNFFFKLPMNIFDLCDRRERTPLVALAKAEPQRTAGLRDETGMTVMERLALARGPKGRMVRELTEALQALESAERSGKVTT